MEWTDVVDNPLLQNLPFKIELNKWGKILMSPASNHHGILQFEVGTRINRAKRSGKIIIECSIQTPQGVKVADIAWASDGFIAKHGTNTPYQQFQWQEKYSIISRLIEMCLCYFIIKC